MRNKPVPPKKCAILAKNALGKQSREAADVAEQAGVTLCLKCHRNTFSETKKRYGIDGSSCFPDVLYVLVTQFYQHAGRKCGINSPFKRTFQPYPLLLLAGNSEVYLTGSVEEWRAYLREFPGDHKVLLEFMPDGRIERLQYEAEILKQIIAGI